MGNEKKVALITGATGELGTAVVEKFLSRGFEVLGTVRPGKAPASTDEDLQYIEVDLMLESDCQAMAEGLKGKALDAVVLSAGGFAMGTLAETDGSAIDRLIALNFKTAYHVIRHVFPCLAENASVVLVSGRPALEAGAGQHMLGYAISKGMLHQLAAILNAEGRSKKITSTVVVPGVLNTATNRGAMPDGDHQKWVSLDRVAKTIAFVCSEDGSEIRDSVIKLYGNS